ncbi:nitrilase-related carbon-nitrogen hydrolase [Streptosporangium sp. NBC_01756]|uniref:nitrilase-related carbon-nitrogen hydrolase n=1 Tax=Streptosporangium sp. NBC_01756 TaxID=2975950 RepID=UPI002DDC4407|nr:nitrilase-related carbon-nitrogen hydrolase [Streptosporangium sp. NBC_01756]WSC85755.1 carbon-nitrogen hydrolase [Streptosporangium sp. NBC_01756]
MVRVAAVQFEVGQDPAANLAACLRMIDAAAAERAELVALPEFCNHLSWYDDRAHAHRMACRPDGPFLTAVAERAVRHGLHIKIGVTLAREDGRTTGTSLLYGPDGRLLGEADKQTLMGAENDHLDPGRTASPVIETPLGRLGMYACMEGVINEVCRSLALRGAQILLNSLNSFAVDEASLHVPVRAAENRVWVVAANKVGPLLPADRLPAIAAGLNVPPEWLHGAGESQIVAPDGTIVARAARTGEAVVVADIDVSRADERHRPDGTHIITARRPDLYAPVTAEPRGRTAPEGAGHLAVVVVTHPPAGSGRGLRGENGEVTGMDPVEPLDPADSVDSTDTADTLTVLRKAVLAGAKLAVLPELAGLSPDEVAEALRGTDAHAVISVRVPRPPVPAAESGKPSGATAHGGTPHGGGSGEPGAAHEGLLIGAGGVVGRQVQLHRTGRHPWATALGTGLEIFELPWGRLAIVVGDDAIFPETFRLAALADADVVAVPFTPSETWELRLGLLERAAENRLNVVAAGHAGPGGLAGAILAAPRDFTLWTAWEGPFTGRISHPIVTPVKNGDRVVHGEVFPAQAVNRQVSRRTDLVDGRPWRLAGALVAPNH